SHGASGHAAFGLGARGHRARRRLLGVGGRSPRAAHRGETGGGSAAGEDGATGGVKIGAVTLSGRARHRRAPVRVDGVPRVLVMGPNARRSSHSHHLPNGHSVILSSLHLRRTRARVVTSRPTRVQIVRTSRSRPSAEKVPEAIPARMRSAAGWTGRRACRLWNQSGSWSAGKVIGENSRTKNTSTWEASWASIAGSVTAIAYPTAVAMVV